jgi:flagellar export protein FliJ
MKKFHFSLQALQTLRERQEQVALREYSQSLQAWEQARNRVSAIQQQLETAWAQMRQSASGNCAATELDRLQTYCQAVERKKQASEYAAKAAQNKAGQAYTRLLAARQARAVVEKFFERQKHRHEREQKRHEQRLLDEMVNHQNGLAALLMLKHEPLWN